MGEFANTLFLLIGLTIVILNGEVYKEFREFEGGEILKYGVLDIGSYSDWLPALQEDKSLPRFQKFLLHLRGLEGLAWFFTNYKALSSGGNVIIPLVILGFDRDITGSLESLVKVTKHERDKGSNFFIQTEMGTIFLDFNLLLHDEEYNEVVRGLRELKIPLGLYARHISRTAKRQLNSIKQNERDSAHLIVVSEFSEKIYDYDTFSTYMNALYHQTKQTLSRKKVDLTIHMNFDVYPWSANEASLLSQFVYRWGEDSKCKVMVDSHYNIDEHSGIDSYKKYLFRSFLSANTLLIGEINYFNYKLLEGHCGVPKQLPSSKLKPNLNEIILSYSDSDRQGPSNDVFKSIRNLNCTIPLSLKYNFGKGSETEISKFDLKATLKFLTDAKHNFPLLFKRIILSLGSYACALYNETVFQEIEKLERNNFTIFIDDCKTRKTTSESVKNFAKTYPDGIRLLISKLATISPEQIPSYDVANILLKSIRGTTSKYSWTSRWNIILDSTTKFYGLSEAENCRLRKSFWNQLLNLATINSLSVLVPLTSLFSFDTRHEFSVNNIHTCIHLPVYEKTAFAVNRSTFGVTFHYSLDRYSTSPTKNVAELLEFISLSFGKIEAVFTEILTGKNIFRAISTFLQSVQYLKNETKYLMEPKIYFNLENLNISSADARVLKKKFNGLVSGAHINLNCAGESEFMLKRNLIRLLRRSVKHVGVLVNYSDVTNCLLKADQNNPISTIDYLIIHVDMATIISTQFNLSPIQLVYDYINRNLNAELFYKIFIELHGWREFLREIFPKLGIYARITWPTTSSYFSRIAFFDVWRFVHEFSSTYDFPIFVYEAFDNDNNTEVGYGWWKFKNFSGDVADPKNYAEKLADYLEMETRRPTKARNEESDSEEHIRWTLTNILVISTVVAVTVIFIIITVAFVKIQSIKKQCILTKQEEREFEEGVLSAGDKPDNDDQLYGMKYDKGRYEISRNDFNKDSAEVIGRGQFGVVYKYYMSRFNNFVAVKLPNVNEKTQLMSILREIKLIAYIGEHKNVVKLLGAYTKEIRSGFVFIVTEYMENGSLLEYLRELNKKHSQDLSELLPELYGFCEGISAGMDYLAEKNVVHGDLAARNVLLDADHVCKISDFGLSKQLYAENIYIRTTAKPLPWAWLAVETLEQSVFTTKSDVWSMGVTFWEIFTLGKQPFCGLRWDLEFTRKLKDELRLPKPDFATDEVYEEILKCWAFDPESRPLPGFFVNFFGRHKQDIVYMDL